MEDTSNEKRNKSLHETACHKKKKSHCSEYETKKEYVYLSAFCFRAGFFSILSAGIGQKYR